MEQAVDPLTRKGVSMRYTSTRALTPRRAGLATGRAQTAPGARQTSGLSLLARRG